MATYKGINGTSVVNYAGDLPNAIDGQVWYDSTAADFKYQYPNLTTAGAWSTGGNLNTARKDAGGAGLYTAALFFGGYDGSDQQTITESYNGTSWTEVADLNLKRSLISGTGHSNTAVLAFGGYVGPPGTTVNTENWNGSSWTEVNNLTVAKYSQGACGTNTAALAFGGNVAPNNSVGQSETWNGSNWAEGNDMNTAREVLAGTGSTTAALAFGGETQPG